MTKKILIIEDTLSYQEQIKEALQGFDVVIEIAETVTEAIHKIKSFEPHIVFLDYQIREGTAVEVMESFKEIPFKIIVMSGLLDDKNVRSNVVRWKPYTFLEKPFTAKQVQEKIKEVKEEIEKEELIELLLEQGNLEGLQNKRVIINGTDDKNYIIILNSILYCEVGGKQTTIFLKNKPPIQLSKQLTYLEKGILSEEYGFFRVGNNHLINLVHIDYYTKPNSNNNLSINIYLHGLEKEFIISSDAIRAEFKDYIGKWFKKI